MEKEYSQFHKDVEDAFKRLDENRLGVSYKEIVNHLRLLSPEYANTDESKFRTKVLGYINRSLGDKFEKVKNGKKHKGKISYKSGVFRLKAPVKQADLISKQKEVQAKIDGELSLFNQPILKKITKKQPRITESIEQKVCSMDATTAHIGKGGEYAVMSELLYNGYYTSQSSVDDGVDIVAYKNNDVFFIQVKTTIVKNDYFVFRIKKESFDRYNRSGMFYVFVLRFIENKKAVSLYIIFPTNMVEHYAKGRYITQSKDEYNIRFRVSGPKVYLVGESGISQDITETNLNQFDLIKR